MKLILAKTSSYGEVLWRARSISTKPKALFTRAVVSRAVLSQNILYVDQQQWSV